MDMLEHWNNPELYNSTPWWNADVMMLGMAEYLPKGLDGQKIASNVMKTTRLASAVNKAKKTKIKTAGYENLLLRRSVSPSNFETMPTNSKQLKFLISMASGDFRKLIMDQVAERGDDTSLTLEGTILGKYNAHFKVLEEDARPILVTRDHDVFYDIFYMRKGRYWNEYDLIENSFCAQVLYCAYALSVRQNNDKLEVVYVKPELVLHIVSKYFEKDLSPEEDVLVYQAFFALASLADSMTMMILLHLLSEFEEVDKESYRFKEAAFISETVSGGPEPGIQSWCYVMNMVRVFYAVRTEIACDELSVNSTSGMTMKQLNNMSKYHNDILERQLEVSEPEYEEHYPADIPSSTVNAYLRYLKEYQIVCTEIIIAYTEKARETFREMSEIDSDVLSSFSDLIDSLDKIIALNGNDKALDSGQKKFYWAQLDVIQLFAVLSDILSVNMSCFGVYNTTNVNKSKVEEKLKKLCEEPVENREKIMEAYKELDGFDSSKKDLIDNRSASILWACDEKLAHLFTKVIEVDGKTFQPLENDRSEPLVGEEVSDSKPTEELLHSAQCELEEARNKLKSIEYQVKRLQDENVGLQAKLKTGDTSFSNEITESLTGMLVNDESPAPEQALLVLKSMFPNEVEILPSALESAKESDFKGKQLMTNLITLVTKYRTDILNGVADTVARKCFTVNTYAANESQTVSQSGLRSLREYYYEGDEYYFEQHLVFGIRSRNLCRVYFRIIADKVVIAYCGDHLQTGSF
ncbi:hypothetical protein [Vibrio barjaei]|uniref:hypothetical protein n=1 Tax=Vibrio barjaei TaxID=1676683 RepID=UPI002284EEA6|nr:hypothetical protein [Vibrio barjaei]MCY9870452.1 hypothetical protein [Vibrio barjaei]